MNMRQDKRSQAIYKLITTPIKIPVAFCTEIKKNEPKIRMEPQKTPNYKSNPGKEEQSKRHHTS